MLSQQDRRALAVIEERLSTECPELERLLAGFDQWAPVRRRSRHKAAWCATVLGAVLLAVAFALRNADVLLLSALLLASGAMCWGVIAVRAVTRHRAASAPNER